MDVFFVSFFFIKRTSNANKKKNESRKTKWGIFLFLQPCGVHHLRRERDLRRDRLRPPFFVFFFFLCREWDLLSLRELRLFRVDFEELRLTGLFSRGRARSLGVNFGGARTAGFSRFSGSLCARCSFSFGWRSRSRSRSFAGFGCSGVAAERSMPFLVMFFRSRTRPDAESRGMERLCLVPSWDISRCCEARSGGAVRAGAGGGSRSATRFRSRIGMCTNRRLSGSFFPTISAYCTGSVGRSASNTKATLSSPPAFWASRTTSFKLYNAGLPAISNVSGQKLSLSSLQG